MKETKVASSDAHPAGLAFLIDSKKTLVLGMNRLVLMVDAAFPQSNAYLTTFLFLDRLSGGSLLFFIDCRHIVHFLNELDVYRYISYFDTLKL
jgi:hypothetical protein